MYTLRTDASEILQIRGVNIYLPKYGYGFDTDNEKIIQPVEIIKRSEEALEQYWEAEPLPEDFEKWVEDEKSKQHFDSGYFNYDYEKFRQKEWHRRLFGVWVWIKGKPLYFTGTYYMFLQYQVLDEGLPVFKKSDWRKYIYWQWNVYNPFSYGMIEVTKRRGGKSVIAGQIMTEYATRTLKAICGIQSKSDDDAKKFFDFHIVTPFQSLAEFWIPTYDTNKGTKPEKVLSFYAASAKGKNAAVKNEQLKSQIDFESSKPYAYDGQKLKRLVLDERGKVDFDLIDAHIVVRKCLLDWRMNIVGKMIVTTTVEEIGIESKFHELWKQSNPEKLNEFGSTKSGLFSFFTPADEAGDCDIYGEARVEKNRAMIAANRAALEGDTKNLIAEIRKDPLNEREAFMMLNSNSHFDLLLLNEMFDNAKVMEQEAIEYGNFVWQDGQPFTKAIWIPVHKEAARWMKPRHYALPDHEIQWIGVNALPNNTIQYISACDPFQNDVTEATINSKASSGVLARYERNEANDPIYNRMFVLKYYARPSTASLFHMDMALQCFAFGGQLLVEAKMDGGLRKFFIDNGLSHFLIRLFDKQTYGIDPNQDNKMLMVNLWEEYILTEGKAGKLIYPNVIDQLSKFNVHETEKWDEVMGLGWTLVADYFKRANFKQKPKPRELSEYFSFVA